MANDEQQQPGLEGDSATEQGALAGEPTTGEPGLTTRVDRAALRIKREIVGEAVVPVAQRLAAVAEKEQGLERKLEAESQVRAQSDAAVAGRLETVAHVAQGAKILAEAAAKDTEDKGVEGAGSKKDSSSGKHVSFDTVLRKISFVIENAVGPQLVEQNRLLDTRTKEQNELLAKTARDLHETIKRYVNESKNSMQDSFKDQNALLDQISTHVGHLENHILREANLRTEVLMPSFARLESLYEILLAEEGKGIIYAINSRLTQTQSEVSEIKEIATGLPALISKNHDGFKEAVKTGIVRGNSELVEIIRNYISLADSEKKNISQEIMGLEQRLSGSVESILTESTKSSVYYAAIQEVITELRKEFEVLREREDFVMTIPEYLVSKVDNVTYDVTKLRRGLSKTIWKMSLAEKNLGNKIDLARQGIGNLHEKVDQLSSMQDQLSGDVETLHKDQKNIGLEVSLLVRTEAKATRNQVNYEAVQIRDLIRETEYNRVRNMCLGFILGGTVLLGTVGVCYLLDKKSDSQQSVEQRK